jgi:periplasmic divalent cation tolerance protein
MKDEKYILVLCTAPTQEVAKKMGDEIVSAKLAACVNIIPGIHSIYRWKGEVCTEPEVLLLIKTVQGHFKALKSKIKEIHPYEVPEIIAITIEAGEREYLNWISSETDAG